MWVGKALGAGRRPRRQGEPSLPKVRESSESPCEAARAQPPARRVTEGTLAIGHLRSPEQQRTPSPERQLPSRPRACRKLPTHPTSLDMAGSAGRRPEPRMTKGGRETRPRNWRLPTCQTFPALGSGNLHGYELPHGLCVPGPGFLQRDCPRTTRTGPGGAPICLRHARYEPSNPILCGIHKDLNCGSPRPHQKKHVWSAVSAASLLPAVSARCRALSLNQGWEAGRPLRNGHASGDLPDRCGVTHRLILSPHQLLRDSRCIVPILQKKQKQKHR